MTTVSTPNLFNVSYVRAGAAFRWQELYSYLESRGLLCIGGRITSIGSSLLLGGGLSYFSGFRGWAANNVVNYEVVLANSSIIQVNNNSAPDLFWALKGGTSNFGIVTRYDLLTFPTSQMFGGTVSWAPNYTQRYLDAQTAFIMPGGGAEDPKAAIMPGTYYVPMTKQNSAGITLLYYGADENPRALENFTSIPTLTGSFKVQNYTAIVNTTAGFAPRNKRSVTAPFRISKAHLVT